MISGSTVHGTSFVWVKPIGIACLVAVSPPRFNHAHYQAGIGSARRQYSAVFATAEQGLVSFQV